MEYDGIRLVSISWTEFAVDQAQAGIAGGRNQIEAAAVDQLHHLVGGGRVLDLTVQPVSFSKAVTQSTVGSLAPRSM